MYALRMMHHLGHMNTGSIVVCCRGVIRGKAAKHLPYTNFETITVILYFCLARFKSYLHP
jgi:hypothetical protein